MGTQALAQEPGAAPTAAELDADIRLLHMINGLALTGQQIERLQPIVRDVQKQQQELEQARNAPEIIRLLRQVRQALLEGKSEEEVEQLRSQLDQQFQQIEQKEQGFAQARQRSVDMALSVLTPEQQERLLEPVTQDTFFAILTAMGQARQVPGEHWGNWLTQASQELALRAARGNRQAAQTTAQEIRQLLTQARTTTEPQLEAQSEQLSEQIAQLLERAGASGSPAWLQDTRRDMMAELVFAERAEIVLAEKLKHVGDGG